MRFPGFQVFAFSGWRRLAIGLAVAFAVVNAWNALNKGGDAAVFFEGGRRFLHGLPLYEGSSAADGFIGPPFQAMFFAPFAAIDGVSHASAALLWYGFNLASLFVAIRLTLQAWSVTRHRLGLPSGDWWPGLFAPLVAVLLPLQTNFEHQNMNALLLGLVAAATFGLTIGAPVIAGVLIGAATALKVFPVLIIVFFAARRYWIAFVTAAGSAVILSVLPVIRYGTTGYRELLRTFWRLANSGWPTRGNNQSLVAAIDRWTGASAVDGVHTAADAPTTFAIFVVVAVVLALAAVPLIASRKNELTLPVEMAAMITLAVLLSPVAWDHYWLLMLPAFVVVGSERGLTPAFWIAAILTSGLSPLTVGRAGFATARELSANTAAGLVLYIALLMTWRKLGKASLTPRV